MIMNSICIDIAVYEYYFSGLSYDIKCLTLFINEVINQLLFEKWWIVYRLINFTAVKNISNHLLF